MKHTPTPWSTERSAQGGGVITINASDWKGLAFVAGSITEGAANAAFIVRACNAYDALLKMLKQGEDIISGLEAECDNAKIDMREARYWWQDAAALIEKLEVVS